MFETTFWRTEMWHPLTLHFPISLLLLATVSKLVAVLLRGIQPQFWDRAGAYLLYAGCLMAWISIYTGDMADGIVSRKLCDPTVLKRHEIAAYNLAYLFTAATTLDLGLRTNLIRVKTGLLQVAVLLLMVVGAGFLIYTSHLGATVVYEQAGGVNIPAGDCAGF